MFISIINDGFRRARQNLNDDHEEIFLFMLKKFLRWTGLKKASEEELYEERDVRMRSKYLDTIECLPEKIDQLLDALNQVGVILILSFVCIICEFFSFIYLNEWEDSDCIKL